MRTRRQPLCVRLPCPSQLHRRAWVEAEFALFLVLLIYALHSASTFFYGNPFAQHLHDAVTLGNGKYQSAALQFVLGASTFIVAFAFAFLDTSLADSAHDETASQYTARLIAEVFLRRTGLELSAVTNFAISDLAALAISRAALEDRPSFQIEYEDVDDSEGPVEGCGMHQWDKVTRWAFGMLVKRKNGAEVDPFPEGVALLKKVQDLHTHFSRSKGAQHKLKGCCSDAGVCFLKPTGSVGVTRISGENKRLRDTIRMQKGYDAYFDKHGMDDGSYDLKLSMREWVSLTEMEAGGSPSLCVFVVLPPYPLSLLHVVGGAICDSRRPLGLSSSP